MSRITGVPAGKASLVVRIVYRMAKRMFGQVPEPLTVNAHNAAVFRATVGYEYFLAKAKRVDARLKALASLKAAALVGCPF
jgi:hypothetical protein